MFTIIFLSAIALLLVFEGIMPLLIPQQWRRFVLEMSSRSDKELRIIGAVLMLMGTALIVLVHWKVLG